MKFLSLHEESTIINHMKDGSIFVYPTDTIYGIGCNALKPKSVKRIREIKKTDHPFSVIAPSFDWIKKYMKIRDEEYIYKLPGPYTLILEKKEPGFLKDACQTKTLGIRVPSHPILSMVKQAGIPFITTSANISGNSCITSVDQLPQEIVKKVDFVVDGGILDNKPSKVIDLTKKEPTVIRSS
ncbi:MAG: L-threonylcarbamoyladenylate synthase [Candidatus Aenigmatarchaeota archaeon]|nr:threonylcarbamoyl-AMP synthase [Nanoarchaeota archaeon]